GTGDGCCVLVNASDETAKPDTQRLVAGQQRRHCRTCAVDQQPAQVKTLPRLLMPSSRGLPPVVICRGTKPSQAARSRPRANVPAVPIAATSAVAFSTPMPGIVASRRAAASALALATN